MNLLIIYLIFILFLNYIFNKYKILSSYSGSSHQKFANKAVTLSGGIFIFFPFLLIFYFELNFTFLFCAFLFFLLGIFSDLNYLNEPKWRLFSQFGILIFLVLNLKIEVLPTRIDLRR